MVTKEKRVFFMLKKLGMVALLLPMLFSAKAQANDYCNTCCDSEWEVYADWLYWKPRCQTLDYATPIVTVLSENGNVERVNPSYRSGFRVGLYYECDDVFYDFFYARLHTNYSNSATVVAPDALLTTRIGSVTPATDASRSISADWSFHYDTVDLLVGSEMHNQCSCFHTRFFGGLKLVFIDQKFTTDYTNIATIPSTISVEQKNKLDGYGINFGLGLDYDFWRCLDFFTRISGDVLLAKFDRSITGVGTTLGVASTFIGMDDDYWNVVSAINLMFGLKYDYKFDGCWCGDLGIAVGYEFHHYFGISDWLSPFQTTGGGLRRDLQNLSLDGLFVRVSLGF
jgi:hypothetical protein